MFQQDSKNTDQITCHIRERDLQREMERGQYEQFMNACA